MNTRPRRGGRWRPLLLACGLFGTMGAAEPIAEGLPHQVLFASGEAGAARYRIPNVHVTRRGTVIAYVEARYGSAGDGTPADLVLRRSVDRGQTWGERQVVVRHAGKANLVFPLLAEERESGALFFFYAERAAGLRGTTRNFFRRSMDEGGTWSDPTEVTAALVDADRAVADAVRANRAGPQFAGEAAERYGREIFVFGPGRPVQLTERHPQHPGRMIVPVFAMKDRMATPRLQRGYGNAILVSDDRGRTWRMPGIVPIGDGESSEVTVAELADGRLVLNSRQSPSAKSAEPPGRTVSFSRDGGDSWTRPRRDESGIPPYPETHSCLLRWSDPASDPTQTARLLFSFPAQNRTRGTILLSYDEHGSWPVRREVVAGAFGYSNLAVLPDQTVLLIYEGGPPTGIHLKHFSLEWLTDGRDSFRGGPQRP